MAADKHHSHGLPIKRSTVETMTAVLESHTNAMRGTTCWCQVAAQMLVLHEMAGITLSMIAEIVEGKLDISCIDVIVTKAGSRPASPENN